MGQGRGRRLVRAAAACLVGAALGAPSIAQAASAVAPVTLSGTYTLMHVDGTAGHPGADGYRQKLVSGGRSYDVSLPEGMAFRSGDGVRLSGHLDGSTLRVGAGDVRSFAPDTVTVSGTTRVLVVLADWTAPDSTTPASAAAVFASDDSWFQQTSYGHLRLSTTVTSWVHVSAPAAGLCTDSSVSDQLTNRALVASGYTAAQFDRVVVYFPSSSDPGCHYVAGFAEAPGTRVWLNGVMDTRSSIHEQGHNYGLYHAHAAVCTGADGAPTAAPDPGAANCQYSDYGDPFDAMGASGYVAEYSASQKQVLGWLDTGRVAVLTTGGSVALVPYEQQSSAVHAASFSAGASRTYWFENRVATGPDAALPAGATGGVLVHVDDDVVDTRAGEASPWAPTQTYLLDQSPADGSLGAAVLAYGQSWTSPEGVTFTVGTPSNGTVTVTASGSTAGAAPASGSTSTPVPPPAAASDLSAQLTSGKVSQSVTEGAAVLVTGTVRRDDGTPADGVTVALQVAALGTTAWRTTGTTTVRPGGFVTTAFRATASADYRLHVASSATEVGSDSNLLTVAVRPSVIAAVTKPKVAHGRPVGLDVSVPGHSGQLVAVQRWYRNAWHAAGTVRLGANGKRVVVVRPAAKGRYRYRFVKAADATHLAAVSKALQVRVS